jgi:PAS domain S-box-containing protein
MFARSTNQYRLAIEGSNNGVALVQNDGHVLVNQRYLDPFGYNDLKELSDKPADTIVHPDDRGGIREYIRTSSGWTRPASTSSLPTRPCRNDGRRGVGQDSAPNRF